MEWPFRGKIAKTLKDPPNNSTTPLHDCVKSLVYVININIIYILYI